MDIKTLVNFFHDGTILELERDEADIVITLQSFPIRPSNIADVHLLANSGCLIGKLHIINVTNIKVESGDAGLGLELFKNTNDILDLELYDDKVCLNILWNDFIGKQPSHFTSWVIEGENVYWENLPHYRSPQLHYIGDYTPIFAGGCLSDIRYIPKYECLTFCVESSQIAEGAALPAEHSPSSDRKIQGKLNAYWVLEVQRGNSSSDVSLAKLADSATIREMSIEDHVLKLDLIWTNGIEECLKVKAGAIQWQKTKVLEA